MKVGAIIPAAGAGRRMGGVRKALLEIAGRPMLQHSTDVLLAHAEIVCVIVPISADDFDAVPKALKKQGVLFVTGGAERADSVRAGLDALAADVDAVLVHDAARPLLTAELIDRVLAPVRAGNSATIALPATDTLHEVDAGGQIRNTPDRARFWRAQTPQAFPRDVLTGAFANMADAGRATDEAGLVAAAGGKVVVVPGETWNIKVTTPDDIALVEALLRERAS